MTKHSGIPMPEKLKLASRSYMDGLISREEYVNRVATVLTTWSYDDDDVAWLALALQMENV